VQTIVYVADPQTATVTYIDDTTGEQLTVDSVAGVSGGSIDYTTLERIAAYEAQGYVLVSNGFMEGAEVFDLDASVDQAYEVHLEHGTSVVSDSVSSTRTVEYVDGVSGESVADPVVQSVSFEREGVKDLVTGEVAWGVWTVADGSSDTFPGVVSPDLSAEGYLAPDRDSVAALTLTGDDALAHPSYSETVVYVLRVPDPAAIDDPVEPDDPVDPVTPDPVDPVDPVVPVPTPSSVDVGGGGLASTGVDVGVLAIFGAGLLLAASVLLVLRRGRGERG
jgi:hypothetical protein